MCECVCNACKCYCLSVPCLIGSESTAQGTVPFDLVRLDTSQAVDASLCVHDLGTKTQHDSITSVQNKMVNI